MYVSSVIRLNKDDTCLLFGHVLPITSTPSTGSSRRMVMSCSVIVHSP